MEKERTKKRPMTNAERQRCFRDKRRAASPPPKINQTRGMTTDEVIAYINENLTQEDIEAAIKTFPKNRHTNA